MNKHEAVRLWEDHVGDSGMCPTDDELHQFALAVQAHTLKPFEKLASKWKRQSREYADLAAVYLLGNSARVATQEYLEYDRFARKLKKTLKRHKNTTRKRT